MFSSQLVYAQLNNNTLLQQMPVNPGNANEVRFHVFASGFSKNNEYFNKIADGYTLFGYQLNPRISYQPASFVRIDAGVLAWKDFGASGYQQIQPTFTVKIQKENWAFLFGTLEGNLSHGYVEPLYDFERVILDRLENGLQYLYHTSRFKMDAWLNWNKMIYVADPDREEVEGGISSAISLLQKEGRWGPDNTFSMRLPLQFTAQHKGGQIDNNDQPLLTVVNAAVGLELEKKYPFELLKRLYTKNYVVGFKDFSNEVLLPYESGTGLYLNVGADTKYQDVMLSYWQGSGYISELGGKLYQSASTTYKNPGYLQQERRLLILRLMKDIEILENLHLTFRLEPVLDLDNPALEFSNSFFLTFDTDFFVAKKK
ncbi:hypothetical protein [Pontibacter beigongshangensis]|uniref:hypothetical protein n=1 Tax=Pontibacter beigongshangensis TaxID=2574733 RepID=UPI001F507A04|nr:hypothetical protein [Pontibacter beigongshangensis]